MGENTSSVNRRKFLSTAATVGTVSAIPSAKAEDAKPLAQRGVTAPSVAEQIADTGEPPKAAASSHADDSGSDFMVDVIKSLGIDYAFSNPGSSFLGLHESIVNYGNNKAPEFITCMHEESSAAMANGYYKAAGKPAAILCHGTVGLQHAAMGLYNAWCDRVPLIAILGNTIGSVDRAGANDWRHSAQDPAALVRDFTKWDDQPTSLQAFAESMVQGYKISTTPPMEPIALVVDSELQEMELHDRSQLRIPKFSPTIPPQGDANALREAAKLLVNAERPVILVDRLANSQAGMDNLVILAETLNIPVIDLIARQNMPTTHYLFQNAQRRQLISQADVILGLEVTDFWGQVTQFSRDDVRGVPRYKKDTKLIRIGSNDLFMRSNYQDFQRYAPADLSIAGDGEATLPALIEAVKQALTDNRKSALAARTDHFKKLHAKNLDDAREAAAYGWDASPISTARLCMELWQQIKTEDWALVSVGASQNFISNWPNRLWKIDKQYQYLGYGAGGGVGYGLPAAVGAALANKALGRFSVNIQCDGDFMYANGALWTAAHHRIPLLTVMHNNRAYAQETMLLQGIANKRHRGVTTANIGTAITNPDIDYAKLAQGMGVWSAGPITNPADLATALKRAIAVVKSGYPALVDVVTQAR